MTYDPKKHHRRSIRWTGRDYAQPGMYFVTLCTHDHQCHFGCICDDAMQLSPIGHAAQRYWQQIPQYHPHIALDEFVIMPNHIHGILVIHHDPTVRANDYSPCPHDHATNPASVTNHKQGECNSPLPEPPRPHGTSKTLGSILRGFKAGVTKWTRQHTHITRLWQRNYFEHVIRNERSLGRIRHYIQTNPATWSQDHENPNAPPSPPDPEK